MASGGYSPVAWASLRCSDFSVSGAQALGMRAQKLWRIGLVALQHVGSPGPGIEPLSPALAGRVLMTVPSGNLFK